MLQYSFGLTLCCHSVMEQFPTQSSYEPRHYLYFVRFSSTRVWFGLRSLYFFEYLFFLRHSEEYCFQHLSSSTHNKFTFLSNFGIRTRYAGYIWGVFFIIIHWAAPVILGKLYWGRYTKLFGIFYFSCRDAMFGHKEPHINGAFIAQAWSVE